MFKVILKIRIIIIKNTIFLPDENIRAYPDSDCFHLIDRLIEHVCIQTICQGVGDAFKAKIDVKFIHVPPVTNWIYNAFIHS